MSPRSTVRISRSVPLDSLMGDKVRVVGRRTYGFPFIVNVPLCNSTKAKGWLLNVTNDK